MLHGHEPESGERSVAPRGTVVGRSAFLPTVLTHSALPPPPPASLSQSSHHATGTDLGARRFAQEAVPAPPRPRFTPHRVLQTPCVLVRRGPGVEFFLLFYIVGLRGLMFGRGRSPLCS